jgi:hypothetical protein
MVILAAMHILGRKSLGFWRILIQKRLMFLEGMRIKKKVNKITIVSGKGHTDYLFLSLDLPNGCYPYTGNASASLTVALRDFDKGNQIQIGYLGLWCMEHGGPYKPHERQITVR